ncbi:ATP-dependent DNA ligase [Candidatus Gottesmanbacteria bacterium]|nr:ATP-dependent DNA ligase [Candidatus Gottesmanbacteria bacterium]
MQFSRLASYLNSLEETSSRNAITEILATLFAEAEADEIGKLCYLLQGRVCPLYEAIEFGVAEKFIFRAIASAYATDPDEVANQFKKLGDIGKAAETLHSGRASDMHVSEVFVRLYDLATTGGVGSQERKIGQLADVLKRVNAMSSRYIVRIPLDKLRLGFSEMTILDSLSWMLAGNKSLRPRLEEVYNVRPDIGFIAETVKREGIKGLSHVRARVGSPVLSQLSQRLPTADEMIEKMGTVAVEPKYDGVRVELHFKRGKWVRTFSRNLEDTTAMFPELSEVGKEIHADEVILDGEAVGLDPATGKTVSFQETTTRKRKHNIELFSKSVPLKFFIFDILYKNGEDLLEVPLSERRKILEATVKPGTLLAVTPQMVTDSAQKLRQYHDDQLKKGLEGAMVKKWDSPYEPGRRGFSWVKFKEEEGKTGKLTDTIDAVVMGYYAGEGKRTSFGIGALLVGVRTGEQFVTVTKIGTGVSDDLWKELKKKLHAIHTREMPSAYTKVNKALIPDVWVSPQVVVELAGDDLTKSPNHGAGYAVRFPRLVKIRTDKTPAQVTTVKELTQMFDNQMNHTKK